MSVLVASSIAWGLTDGPTMPEYTSFAQFDATDLVNLTSGNFQYTIPLLNIPGKGGSYPLALGYNSGIKAHQEASWVGLGWNLNAGAINRAVVNIPDDYYNAPIYSSMYNAGVHGNGIKIGLGICNFGAALTYDNNLGFGFDLSARLTASIPIAKTANSIGGGIGLFGSGGASIATGISPSGQSYFTGGPQFGLSLSAFGGGMSTSLASFSVGGGWTLFETPSNASDNATLGDIHSYSEAQEQYISLPWFKFGIIAGFSEWGWSLTSQFLEGSNGFMHQSGPGNMRSSRGTHDKGTTLERIETTDYIVSSPDLYMCNAAGITGVIKPRVRNTPKWVDGPTIELQGRLVDESGNYYNPNNDFWAVYEKSSGIYSLSEKEAQSASNIKFHYLNDMGPSSTGESASDWRVGSKKVEPVIDEYSGNLNGFIITSTDGTIYEFLRPLYNRFEASYTTDVASGINTAKSSKKIDYNNYAYTWLITSIKSPQYVDINSNGPDELDYGFWVKFSYENSDGSSTPELSVWRAPYKNNEYQGSGNFTASVGLKDIIYLSKIETATHYANFNLKERLDNKPPSIDALKSLLDESIVKPYISYKDCPWGEGNLYDAWGKMGIGIVRLTDAKVKTLKTELELLTVKCPISTLTNNTQYKKFTKEIRVPYSYGKAIYEGKIRVAHETYNYTNNMDPWVFSSFFWKKDNWELENGYMAGPAQVIGPETLGKFIDNNKSLMSYWDEITKEFVFQFESYRKCSTNETIDGSSDYNERFYGVYLSISPDYFEESSSKKMCLDDIEFYKKLVDKDTLLQKIDFTYDYSLAKGTESSLSPEKGRLTLKKLQDQVPVGDKFINMPPYQFSYQSGKGNPNFENGKNYDVWGMYNPKGSIRSKKHMTPQDLGDDVGVVWNLEKIRTPDGTKIEVSYKRDKFMRVCNDKVTSFEYNAGNTYKYLPFSGINGIPENKKFMAVARFLPHRFNAYVGNDADYTYAVHEENTYLEHKYFCLLLDGDKLMSKNDLMTREAPFNAFTYLSINENLHSERKNADFKFKILNGEIYNLKFQDPDKKVIAPDMVCNSPYFEIIGGIYFDESEEIGGDVKVETITYSNSMGSSYSTTYDFTSGYTQKFPEYNKHSDDYTHVVDFTAEETPFMKNFKIKDITRATYSVPYRKINELKAKNSSGYDIDVSKIYTLSDNVDKISMISSGVTYSNCKIKNSQRDGHLKYSFFSPADSVVVDGVKKGIVNFSEEFELNGYVGTNYNSSIEDYSSIIGQPKSFSIMSATEELQKIVYEYNFSNSTVSLTTETDEIQGTVGNYPELQTFDKKTCLYGEYRGNNDSHVIQNAGTLNVERPNSFIQTISTTNNGVTSYVKNVAFDSLTGTPISILTDNGSDPYPTIDNIKLAYTEYEGLKEKNMLSQIYQKSSYIDNNGNEKADLSECNSSSTTEWKKSELPSGESGVYSYPQWFSDKIWNWEKSDFAAVNNPPKRDDLGAYESSYDGKWLLVSQVDSFSNDGLPIQDRNVDNVPSSLLRGFPDSSIVALINDAEVTECLYDCFEDNYFYDTNADSWKQSNWTGATISTNNAYSGSNSVDLSNGETIEKSLNDVELISGKSYLIHFMLKGSVGKSINLQIGTVDTTITVIDEKWNQVEVNFEATGSESVIKLTGGACYIDDFRLHPSQSTMSTYLYDPVSLKVTAICGPNMGKSTFSYDEQSRLTSIKNSDDETVSETSYNSMMSDELNVPVQCSKSTVDKGESFSFTWPKITVGNIEKLYVMVNGEKFELDKKITGFTAIAPTDKGYLEHIPFSVHYILDNDIRVESNQEYVRLWPNDLFEVRDIAGNIVPRIKSHLVTDIAPTLSAEKRAKFLNTYVPSGDSEWYEFSYKDPLLQNSLGDGKNFKYGIKKKFGDYQGEWIFSDQEGGSAGSPDHHNARQLMFSLLNTPANNYPYNLIATNFKFGCSFKDDGAAWHYTTWEQELNRSNDEARRLQMGIVDENNVPIESDVHVWYRLRRYSITNDHANQKFEWTSWGHDWELRNEDKEKMIERIQAQILVYEEN